MIGKVLGSRYEITEKIGEGGMAVVYKAHCNKLDRFVAIKILKEEFVDDEQFIRKFRQESRAAGHLSNPHVVNVYDVGEDEIDGKPIHYIVMELVEGETLKDRIKRGIMPPKQAMEYAIEIAEALKIAHKNHIIHRDIKPHNILIDKENRIKVADFGIARAVTNFTITTTSGVLGSVHYFSPEQARGGYTDAKSDLYSLGVVMYEMATGKLPYDGDTPIAVAMKHVQEEPIPPRDINPEISEDFEKVILKALAKRQTERYQSASELIRDLRGIARGENIDIEEPFDDKTRVMPIVTMDDLEKEVLLGDDEYVKTEGGFRKILPIFVGVLLALSLFGIFLLTKHNLSGAFEREKSIPTPGLVGKPLKEAEKILSGLNLKYKTEEIESNEAPGTIIEQEPKEGTEIKKDFPIKLKVAKEEEVERMPDVRDLAVKEANRKLEEAGLFLSPNDISYDNSETVPKDAVIEQYPAPDTKLDENTVARITISLGKKGDSIVMPYVTGKNIDEAKKKLNEALIEKISVRNEKNSGYDKDVVYYQSISAGDIIDKDTEVELYVSLGSEETKEDKKPEKEQPKKEPEKKEPSIQSKTVALSPKAGVETTVIQITKIYNGVSEVVYTKELSENDDPVNVKLTGEEGSSFDIIYNGQYESTITIP